MNFLCWVPVSRPGNKGALAIWMHVVCVRVAFFLLWGCFLDNRVKNGEGAGAYPRIGRGLCEHLERFPTLLKGASAVL